MIAYKKKAHKSAKSFHLGIIAYWLFFAPLGLIRKYLQRDPISRLIDERERRKMELAVFQMKPTQKDGFSQSFKIYFLSGNKFWYQTCFCAYSMMKYSDVNLCPVIYDDGTLEEWRAEEIVRAFPEAKIIYHQETETRLDHYLPDKKFPFLRERRVHYPNIKKLTDVHAGSTGWKLVLDSDMLFFRRPTFLLGWLKCPERPCHMVDIETSYGYSGQIMSSLARTEIAERLNVGICGMRSEEIDWEKLEFWCKTLIGKEKTNYYLEQALIAMLFAGRECDVAPTEDYIVLPRRDEVINPKAVLHHYVADSKPWYFRYGWRHILNKA